MLKLKKIAITGGIASGKSSACRFFKELGAYVVSADEIAHELLNPHTNLGQQILRHFGSEIAQNEQISRRTLAEQAFKDPEKLKKLEELLHPEVFKKIESHYRKACEEGKYSSFVVEIPLLFEIKKEKDFDIVISVLSDEQQAKKRFEKSGFPVAEYNLRMKRQLPPKKKQPKLITSFTTIVPLTT